MGWLVAAVTAVVLALTAARADGETRLGLVEVSPELEAALRTALDPWGIELARVAGPPPTGDGADAIAHATRAARAASADALLWTTTDELWLFDVASAELSVRRIPAERDEATLAALALSAKTMLRTTAVAPPSERFGAVDAPDPTADGAPVARAWQLRVHARSELRLLSTGAGRASEPRLGVAVSWWPASLRDRAGLSVAVAAGPGFAIDAPLLLARHTDTTVELAARARAPLRGRLGVAGLAGLAMHRTSLDGYAPAHDTQIAVTRSNASLDGAASIHVALSAHGELAVELGTAMALRRQRYLVAGVPVLELPLFEGHVAVELRVSLR